MKRLWPALERASQHALTVAGWCYLAMTGLICFDIAARRVLGFSSGATSELSGYLLAVGMAWGLAAALIERAHVRIDLLVQRLRPGARAWLHATALAVLLVVSGFFAWGAVAVTIDSWQLDATDVSLLRTPLALPQGLWAAGLALFFVVAAALFLRVAAMLLAGRHAAVEGALATRSYEEEVEETLEATRAGR